MRTLKCPKCNNWLSVQDYDEDVIHQCRENTSGDSPLMTRRGEEHHQFTQQTIKWDDPNWENLGRDTMPRKIGQTRREKNVKALTNVNWFFKV